VLPVKIKLENPLLGGECYIGSNTEPIELALTTGATSPPAPNKSIKGKLGELTSKAEGKILVINKNTLVVTPSRSAKRTAVACSVSWTA